MKVLSRAFLWIFRIFGMISHSENKCEARVSKFFCFLHLIINAAFSFLMVYHGDFYIKKYNGQFYVYVGFGLFASKQDTTITK